MEIVIPDEQYEKLAERAVAVGYTDVPSLIEALACEPIADPRGVLDEEALQQSVSKLEAADASIEAGLGVDAEEALHRVAAKHGLAMG